jgi:hypothetical protein
MSVSSGDIKIYGSVNMQEDDTSSPQGGAINTGVLMIFDNSTLANDPHGAYITVESDNAAEKGLTTVVYGRAPGGSIIPYSFVMNGTSPVSSNTTLFERILKVICYSGGIQHTGNIIIKDNAGSVITTIPSGVTGVRRPFYNVSSDIVGGSTRTWYEKVFVRNNNASTDLLSVTISEVAGGVSASGDFDLEKNINGSNTSTNRLSAPTAGGMQSSFDSTAKILLSDTNIPATGAVGVWLRLQLAPGTPAQKSTYTLAVSGSTI